MEIKWVRLLRAKVQVNVKFGIRRERNERVYIHIRPDKKK